MNRALAPLAALLLASCSGRTPAPAPPSQLAAPPATTGAAASAPFEIELGAPAAIDESTTATISASVPGTNPDENISVAWKQLAGPKVELAKPYAAKISFVAPEAIADYELRFEARVERNGVTATKQLALTVHADDDPPAAEAYAPPFAECGERVVVTGQGRSPEPQHLTMRWHQIGSEGPRVSLEAGGTSQASFIAPQFSGRYTVWLEFTVSDGVHPPVGTRVQIPVECDAKAQALPAGKTRALSNVAGTANELPRGDWNLSGSLTLTPDDAEHEAVATLRFEYDTVNAAVLALTKTGDKAGLRMFGLVRDSAASEWHEPQSSGKRDLGEWPADQALGFELDWDGRELAVHWGPPGMRKDWPELPYPALFRLASRPRAVVIEARGGAAVIQDLVLTGR